MTEARIITRSFDWIDDELEVIHQTGVHRRVVPLSSAPGPEVVLDGRRYLLLGSNNYLDLAGHPEVIAGAVAATRQYGAGSGASRLLSGAIDLQSELEKELARVVAAPTALLFSSGYLANISTIAALVGRGDEVFSDELNHASLIDGCRLSGARVNVYRHGDVDYLRAALLMSSARRRLVVSDTVFSMEGDTAPVRSLAEAAAESGAMLLLDESHALGILGPGGGGVALEQGLEPGSFLLMGTLSKALGSAGGFIAAASPVVDFLRNRARGFIFDTAAAPATVGAALASLVVMRREPERRARLHLLTRRLRDGLGAAGLDVLPGEAAIVPVVIGDPRAAIGVATAAKERWVLAPAIRPPSVPPGTSRLRLTLSAGFSDEQVDRAVSAIVAARSLVGS